MLPSLVLTCTEGALVSSEKERGVKDGTTARPASWPYLGARAPPLAEPVGRTLRSGVFDVAERAAALTSDNLHSLNCLHLHALLHMELAEQRRTQGMCHRCTQNWVACQKCGTKRPAGRAGCGHAWLGGKACGAPRLGRSVLVPSSAYPGTGMRGAQGQFDQRKCGEPGAAVTRIHSLRSRF